ncbi:MAG: hypothetical protein MJ239_07475 [Bacilli bacterium]|nr:hypothetical protein [Bacilli bacterium]
MTKFNVKVVAEGNEERAFFEIVKEIGTHPVFDLDIENAEGSGKIPDVFISAFREPLYDCVICVYDVDGRINDSASPYNSTRNKLISFFGDEKIADAVSFCTNPNILQLFLLAADPLQKVALKATSKKSNSALVHQYWPNVASDKTDKFGRKTKSGYDAQEWQLDIMKYSIINGSYTYESLLKNAKELPIDYVSNFPGSNLLPLLVALKSGDTSYFKRIVNVING